MRISYIISSLLFLCSYILVSGQGIPNGEKYKQAILSDRFCGEGLQVFEGHTRNIVEAVVSEDGQYVATESRDSTLRVWAADTLDAGLLNRINLFFTAYNNEQNRFEELFSALENSTERAIVVSATYNMFRWKQDTNLIQQLGSLAMQIDLAEVDYTRNEVYLNKTILAETLYLLALKNEDIRFEQIVSQLDSTQQTEFYFSSLDAYDYKPAYYTPNKNHIVKAHLDNILPFVQQLEISQLSEEQLRIHIQSLNNMGWGMLEFGDFASSEAFLRLGISIDATYAILHTNLAPALLFQGKYEAALAEYKKWKNQPYKTKTYGYAYLRDFRYFEKYNIIPDEHRAKYEEVKTWLLE